MIWLFGLNGRNNIDIVILDVICNFILKILILYETKQMLKSTKRF